MNVPNYSYTMTLVSLSTGCTTRVLMTFFLPRTVRCKGFDILHYTPFTLMTDLSNSSTESNVGNLLLKHNVVTSVRVSTASMCSS